MKRVRNLNDLADHIDKSSNTLEKANAALKQVNEVIFGGLQPDAIFWYELGGCRERLRLRAAAASTLLKTASEKPKAIH